MNEIELSLERIRNRTPREAFLDGVARLLDWRGTMYRPVITKVSPPRYKRVTVKDLQEQRNRSIRRYFHNALEQCDAYERSGEG